MFVSVFGSDCVLGAGYVSRGGDLPISGSCRHLSLATQFHPQVRSQPVSDGISFLSLL